MSPKMAPASGPTGMAGISPLLSSAGRLNVRQIPQVAMEAESLFLTQLVQQMRQAMVASVKGRKTEHQEYQVFIDQHLARTLAAGGGLGLARRIFDDLAPRLAAQEQEARHEPSGRKAPCRTPESQPLPAAPATPGVPGAGAAGPDFSR